MTAVRFRTLDGLRGVAALVIVWFHLGFLGWVPQPRFGYLAVDLFFLLSGFVLAHGYESRFRAGLGAGGFMLRRAIRLFPLYWAGLVLGAVVNRAWLLGHPLRAGLILAANAALLPTPFGDGVPPGLFPLDPPVWSLFLEFWVANWLYAAAWRWLTPRRLAGLVAVGAAGLVATQVLAGDLDKGVQWSAMGFGLARVITSFFAGVLLARWFAARPPRLVLPGWALLLVLVAALALPLGGGFGARLWELACVGAVFPALIYWGASARERAPWVGRWLGDASYAVYVVHFMLIPVAAPVLLGWGLGVGWGAAAGFMAALCSVGGLLAWGFDAPVRLALGRGLARRAGSRVSGPGAR